MLDRIIDISKSAASLRVENSLLVIAAADFETTKIPLDEVAVLLISHPAVVLTHAVLSELARNGAMTVCCDGKFQPAGMLLPLQSNFEQSLRFRKQLEAGAVLKKRLWQRIVSAKIANQHAFLRKCKIDLPALRRLADGVKSGDADNAEAVAAKLYWEKLDLIDRRDRNAGDANSLLNYGYAVLYAACARALCAAGLHPAAGIFHRNAYNPFCLASDMMEPFRVLVDEAACRIAAEGGGAELDPAAKRILINAILEGTIKINGKREKVLRALAISADSLARIYCGEGDRKELLLPQY